ncbi:MAG: PEP-CTERM sorting domain-containing protein [Rhodocyclaceae bacterium]|nr:PEP-CTERM sorting domain-containing protein [Rhodocyclaceae bacterium]
MKLKAARNTLAGLVLAATSGVALADFTNGPNPYAAGYGFDTPQEASWGGWTRGTGDTLWAEWDTFIDRSYGTSSDRTAAADVGSYGATNVNIGWNPNTFPTGTGNLYSFSVTSVFNVSLTDTTPIAGPVRAVLQTEGWGVDIDLASVTLNGVSATAAANTFNGVVTGTPVGDADVIQRYFYWDLAAAPTAYNFSFAGAGHSLSLTQVAVDVAALPVPEPETYAMLMAGLGLMGAVARRRRKA